jgi:hypothetical protein
MLLEDFRLVRRTLEAPMHPADAPMHPADAGVPPGLVALPEAESVVAEPDPDQLELF